MASSVALTKYNWPQHLVMKWTVNLCNVLRFKASHYSRYIIIVKQKLVFVDLQ